MKDNKIISSTEGNFLKMNTSEYKDKNNNTQKWEWVERVGPTNAVVIVPLYTGLRGENKPDRIVVIREFRVPIDDYEWGFPSGLIDEGESIPSAAIRELKEETGLECSSIKHQSPIVYNSAGLTNEGCSIVHVECFGEISKKLQEKSEDIEIFLMKKSDICYLLESRFKVGAKAYIIMKLFLNN